MQSSFSYFVRFETIHNVEESWGFVSLDFIVRHNDKVLHIVILSSIEGKIVEMSVSPFEEISCTSFEWFYSVFPILSQPG